MGLLGGATSLVELIVKKFGDDIDGATQELVRMGGFPESVARRIATGELPMDAESVARRADEQGYDASSLLYHGTEEGVTDFSPSAGGELGGGVYVTKDPTQASEYARKQYGGPYQDGANVIPVYSKPLKQTERDDWVKSRSENMGRLREENNGEWEARFAREAEREIADDVSAEGYGGIYLNNPIGERSLMYDQGVIYDPNNIRSPNAAFDPEYKGSNIMGNATVPMLGGTAAITAAGLAAPALMKDGVFQHTASETPIVERKKPVRNQSGLLESVTDFGDEVFKSVRHAAGPLADVFMPYEGVNNYLKTVNDYDKQPTWWDRLGILDF